MITNGRTEFQSKSIQGLGIKDYFDTILISEAEQIRKPQPEIFHTAVSRLKATVETSVYIGDNPQADIIGAANILKKVASILSLFYDFRERC